MKRAVNLYSASQASHPESFRDTIVILLSFTCVLLFMGKAQSQTAVMLNNEIQMKSATPLMFSNDSAADNQKIKQRTRIMAGVNIAGYGGSLLLFNNAWYKNFPRSAFHSFNDIKEWQQMDKIGHSWAAYNTGRVATSLWRWTGMNDKKAVMIGGLSGAGYLTAIEIMDGFSEEWGWSWGDIGANFFGSGMYMVQELKWKEQRIQYKFSFHKKNYADATLTHRADKLFGKSWYERMLKDYNGQTYWLSANLKSFLPKSKLPSWLSVAAGCGSEGMMGGFSNKWIEGDPGFAIDRSDVKRYRQWYLAPDVDLSKIKTNKKGVKILLNFLNAFKFPMPALELSNGKLSFKPVVF